MAGKEGVDKAMDMRLPKEAAAVRNRVEFWASTMDAFLQDFMRSAVSNDRLGTVIACARLAQLGDALSQEYRGNVLGLVDSDTELKVAQQACRLVVDLVNRNGDECGLGVDDGPVLDTAPGDKTQN